MKIPNSLAVFVHYSKDGKLCPNALLYAKELTKSFNKVVIASNAILEIEESNIACLTFPVNAYDFGYFYQTLELLNAYEHYQAIGFFNDSNYILKPLDDVMNWVAINKCDFCGITDSWEKRPDIKEPVQYHIQSHFLVFKNNAIKKLQEYFTKIEFWKMLDNKIDNVEDVRAKIIIDCEILMTRYMQNCGIRVSSYFMSNNFVRRVSKLTNTINVHVILWKELIENKYPFIKKKIVHQSFPENDMRSLINFIGMTPMSHAKTVIEKTNNIYSNTINI